MKNIAIKPEDYTILAVDDIATNIMLLKAVLSRAKYKIVTASSGFEALQKVAEVNPDLILLDIMMPDLDGYEVLKRLKADPAHEDIPVIFLTALHNPEDIVKGFKFGASDYISKPFGIMEFISRVRAVLRRAAAAVPAPAASTLRFGDIVLDDVSRTVRVGGVPVELTFKEYALLHLFLEHPEEVLARERIMKDVWDTDDLLESRTIDMHVRTLRQKLGAAGEAIRTVRKVGYKLSTEGSDD